MTAVLVYLASIVAANLLVMHLGPSASIGIAFVFIGLDLTLRDRLHEAWKHRNLLPKMGALILAGSILTYAINRGAGTIAMASFAAFCGASVLDMAVYMVLEKRGYNRQARILRSNIAGAAVDSIVFPVMAFGALMPLVIAMQFMAKVLGGYVWSQFLFYSNHTTTTRQTGSK